MNEYVPSKEILDKYADVLINFALNEGEGVKAGEVVMVTIPESAKPMYDSIYKSLILAGAHPIMKLAVEGNERWFFNNASVEQLEFFPDKYYKGVIDQIDHSINIIADKDPRLLSGVDSKKIFLRQNAFRPWKEWRDEKEGAGKFFWTLAMYGTPAMAKEAGLSLEEYWQEIVTACYLDEDDPVAKWREFVDEATALKKKLDDLDIDKLRVVSENTDLTIGIGEKRKWLGASCRNIPSFELFISPDWRETRGYIQFTEKLYRYGTVVEDVYLEFNEEGCVKKATASKGEDVLLEMIKQENANKVGEFSLTDKRFSKITKFMAQTLFDENVGGPAGNTHIALGNAYRESYAGDIASLKQEDWKELGFNESIVHTDIVSTEDRVVTATLKDGSSKVIYKDGMFTL